MILPTDLIKMLRGALRSGKYLVLIQHLEKDPKDKKKWIMRRHHKMRNFPVSELDGSVPDQIREIKERVAKKITAEDGFQAVIADLRKAGVSQDRIDEFIRQRKELLEMGESAQDKD